MDLTTPPSIPPALGGAAVLPAPASASPGPGPTAPRRRPWYKTFIHLLRRGHLYAGLFMLPWVLLYGVTAFLFNHPTVFSDQAAASFDKEALAGTPMESPPAPVETARQVVAALRARAKPGTTYTLVDPDQVRYTREFAFATVTADGSELSVLMDVTGGGGSIRSRPTQPEKPEERPPFAIGGRGRTGPSGGSNRSPVGERGGPRPGDGLKLDNPLPERVKAAVPRVLERAGLPQGEVTVTSVPDLTFLMEAEDKVWRVTYNAQAGSVTGRPAGAAGDSLPTRRFLTRLHVAHGYPSDVNARWAWAVIVDGMAGIMVFWGLSGLVMWWQIKAVRWLGTAVLLASVIAAVWVGWSMHDLMAASPVGR